MSTTMAEERQVGRYSKLLQVWITQEQFAKLKRIAENNGLLHGGEPNVSEANRMLIDEASVARRRYWSDE